MGCRKPRKTVCGGRFKTKSLAKGMAGPLKPIKTPPLSPELCELVGAIAGDGCIQNGKAGCRVSLCGNLAKDYEYVAYLAERINGLFGLETLLSANPAQCCVSFTIYSRRLCEYFIENFGFNYGAKSHTLRIPPVIKQDNETMRAFVRGLFDTDGCVVMQKMGRYQYPAVKICTACREFAYSLRDFLREDGFKCFVSVKRGRGHVGYDVTVKGKGMLPLWAERIGSSNPRNIKKIKSVGGAAAIRTQI